MTCKVLKEQSSMYAGIGRRMSSFLFGAGVPQGAALVGTIYIKKKKNASVK